MSVPPVAHRSTRRCRAVFLWALRLSVIAGSLTPARGWARDDDALLIDAVQAKEEALDSGDLKAWQRAFDLFQAIDKRAPSADTRYELGLVANHLGHVDIATQAYATAIQLGLRSPAKERAEAYVAEHRTELGMLVVISSATGEVMIDGIWRGALERDRRYAVVPGEHVIARRTPDGAAMAMRVNVAVGQTLKVNFGGKPKLDPELPREVQVRPRTTSPESMSTPASATGRAAPATDALPTAPTRDMLPEAESRAPAVAWSLLIGGATVAVAGVAILPLSARGIEEERRALTDNCDALRGTDACAHARADRVSAAQDNVDAIASWKAARVSAWMAVGVGSAASLVGAGLLLFNDNDQGAKAAPMLGPALIGATVTGRF